MIDTHAHLAERFGKDVDRIVAEAKTAGVKAIILSASSMKDSEDNLKIANIYKNYLYPAIGVHPQESEFDKDKLETLLQKNPQILAIGECGLEFTQGANKKWQEKIFRAQIELAQKYQKPLIVHSREASDKTIEILSEYKVNGVIHCYTGGKKRVKKVLNIPGEWYFGIDGNITYEIGLEQVVAEIPKDRLVLETDTPFLAPIPYRGQENRPAYIKYIYQKVSEIWGEECEGKVDENGKRLFNFG